MRRLSQENYLKGYLGNALAIQWLGLYMSTAAGPGSICGQGTKILQAMQPKKFFK